MKLIDDWKQHLKHAWSVRFAAASAALTTLIMVYPTFALDVWNVLPDALRSLVPPRVALVLPLLLTIAGIYARVVVQPKLSEKPDAE